MFTAHRILAGILAEPPSPTPTAPATGGEVVINTHGIIGTAAQTIVPLILAFLALRVMARAHKGRVSEVVTSSGISIWGLVLLAGAASMMFIGDDLVNLIFKH